MEKVQRYRAMGSLCRQHAAYNPTEAWKLLAEAERWEHLAVEASCLKESNSSGDLSKAGAIANSNDARWKTTVAA